MTQTATARCAATTRSGGGCRSPAMTGTLYCHGHDPGRAEDRVRIARQGGRARSRPAPDNAWSDIGEEELAARNQALERENRGSAATDMLINTRARDTKNDKPLPDRLVAQDALRSARTRRAWAEWHRAQAERHRATLTALVARHEAAADRLEGGG